MKLLKNSRNGRTRLFSLLAALALAQPASAALVLAFGVALPLDRPLGPGQS